MTFDFRIATPTDAPDIATLVNRAYRPAPHEAGWTHEASLVAGDRTTRDQVLALFDGPSTLLVLCHGSSIVACVQVQACGSSAYIGMLATDPALQAQGLGKQMLARAESYATVELGATQLRMSVLSTRSELLAFYERRGYMLTGEVEQYPLSAGVGVPLVDGMVVLSLAKKAVHHA